MELALFTRVLWRFRVLVGLGALVGGVLALLSFYSVSLSGGKPTLTHRKAETWQAASTIFLTSTQPVVQYTDPGRYIGLAPLYAQFANSDPVRQATISRCGRLPAGYTAVPAADTTYGAVNVLPMVNIYGTAATPAIATRMADCATKAYLEYMQSQQVGDRIPKSQRVRMTVINEPSIATSQLIAPRKKTLPIVVFMAVLCATIGLAFILENARLGIRLGGESRSPPCSWSSWPGSPHPIGR